MITYRVAVSPCPHARLARHVPVRWAFYLFPLRSDVNGATHVTRSLQVACFIRSPARPPCFLPLPERGHLFQFPFESEYCILPYFVAFAIATVATISFLFAVQGGVHAVAHALLAVVPLFLLCDRADVDCEHARPHHQRPQPTRVLVFDKRPGGVGVSDAMFGCHRY